LVLIQSWAKLQGGTPVRIQYDKLVEAQVQFPPALPGEQITPESDDASEIGEGHPTLVELARGLNRERFPLLFMFLQERLLHEKKQSQAQPAAPRLANSSPPGAARNVPARVVASAITTPGRVGAINVQTSARGNPPGNPPSRSSAPQQPPPPYDASMANRRTSEGLVVPVGVFTDKECEESHNIATSVRDVINSTEPSQYKFLMDDLLRTVNDQLNKIVRNRLTAVGFLERADPSVITQTLRVKIRLERVIAYALKLSEIAKNSAPSEVSRRVEAAKVSNHEWEQEELVQLISEGLAEPTEAKNAPEPPSSQVEKSEHKGESASQPSGLDMLFASLSVASPPPVQESGATVPDLLQLFSSAPAPVTQPSRPPNVDVPPSLPPQSAVATTLLPAPAPTRAQQVCGSQPPLALPQATNPMRINETSPSIPSGFTANSTGLPSLGQPQAPMPSFDVNDDPFLALLSTPATQRTTSTQSLSTDASATLFNVPSTPAKTSTIVPAATTATATGGAADTSTLSLNQPHRSPLLDMNIFRQSSFEAEDDEDPFK